MWMAVSDEPRRPDRSHPLPLWAQVLDDLRRRLAHGAFISGFPTDRELMDEYGVSRHTAREAVRRLQAEGVLRRQRGRGTFVTAPEIEQVVGPMYSLFRSVEEQGFEQRSQVLTLELTSNPAASSHFGLAGDATLIHLERLRMVDGSPLALDQVWIPSERCPQLIEVDFTHTALYAELERLCGLAPTAGWERIRPALPDRRQQELLGIPARQPAFLIERFSECDGIPLEWRCTLVRGDQYSFVTRWSGSTRAEAELQMLP
jgi:GntR family transcriptional regulator